MKAQADIEFIKHCKSEDIIPISSKVNVSWKHSNHKLKSSMAKIVMEADLQQKNIVKRKS